MASEYAPGENFDQLIFTIPKTNLESKMYIENTYNSQVLIIKTNKSVGVELRWMMNKLLYKSIPHERLDNSDSSKLSRIYANLPNFTSNYPELSLNTFR